MQSALVFTTENSVEYDLGYWHYARSLKHEKVDKRIRN